LKTFFVGENKKREFGTENLEDGEFLLYKDCPFSFHDNKVASQLVALVTAYFTVHILE